MGFLRYTKVIMPVMQAMAGDFTLSGQSANLRQEAAPGPGSFNGKKTQVNPGYIQDGGSYEFLNKMKHASVWSTAGFLGHVAVAPDWLDADGYLVTMAGNAASGIITKIIVPSQAQRPGVYILKWDGDTLAGSSGVNFGNASVTPIFHAISAITQSGTIQTFTLTTSPVHMRAGQPIALSNISGGTWGGLSFNNWRVLDVNAGTNSFRVNSGTTFTGTLDPLTNARATFTDGTIVANTGVAGGLNGSGRFVAQPNALLGGADGFNLGCGIRSIQSSSNYPHNIRIVHQDDEVALDAGGIFTPAFLAKIAQFGVVRHLNWQDGNVSNVTSWYTRKRESYYAYGGYSYDPALYVGATTSLSGSTYTVAAPAVDSVTGGAYSSLKDKTTIHVKFAQSARPTSTFTGTVAFNTGTFQWEVTVNSGLTGFIAIGQTLVIAGQATNSERTLISGSGSVWQINGSAAPAAASSVSCSTRQNFNSPNATFTSGNANISIPNNVYQAGDKISFYDVSGFGGAVFPPNVTQGAYYYVVSAVNSPTGTIQISASSSLTPVITPNGTSSNLINSSIVLFLNAPGTSANPKQILSEYSTDLSGGNTTIDGGNNSYPVSDNTREIGTLVYDATFDAWIKHGGDYSMGSCGIVNVAPVETMLALGWQIGAHNWLVSPFMACDPMTDWWANVMLYDKTNRPAWAKLRIEPPNELWNTGANFFQTAYAQRKARAYSVADPTHWTANDFYNWYGKVLSTIGQMAYQIYGAGNLNVTYQVLGGVQTATGGSPGDIANSLNKFRAASYAGAGTFQGPLTGAWGTVTFAAVPPVPWSSYPSATPYVSHITVATYFASNTTDFRGTGGPQTMYTLATDFGGIKFVGTNIVAGVLHPEPPTALTTGMTLFLPLGLGTATVNSGSDGAGWTLSNASLNIPYTQPYYAAKTSGLAAPATMVASVIDTVIDATVNGSILTVHSIISGNTVGEGLQIYGGTIPHGSGLEIAASGTYPNFTLTGSVAGGPQRANFSVGLAFSLTGCFRLWQNWGTWANTNFGITKICAYEGGYSNDYAYGTSATILTARSKQETALQGYTTQMLDNFRGLGAFPYPGGMTGEFPSNFLLTGPYPSGSAWSVLDDIYQNPTSPQWNSIIAY